ncbi:putative ribonuclease H-like domain-containing protein [Tanacetum coccineum]
MDLETAQTTTTAKLSILKQGEYDMWRLRIEQYFQVQDYALWDVIENGNSFKPEARTTTNADGTSTSQIPGPVTADEKTQKKNDVKARKTRFGGNEATKKTQRNSIEANLRTFRNKHDLDTMSFDDLYNNFKIVEQEVKGTASSSSSSQNLAFMSSTSSTNEVNTAYGVSTANTQASTASTQTRALLSNEEVPSDMALMTFSDSEGHPQIEDQGYVDSGCSRHMTGNMSYLLDFKEFAGGYVTLGEGSKEEELPGKGTLKLTCDKKNNILFTDTGCFVLSPNFKLADESQVLLKVPRKNNMYSVDMKNIVPKESLTCLVAKATLDEIMLWHRRLGHINFKTINKLVKDNLDLFGPTYVSNLMNKKYSLVVNDDYSRFTWVFFVANKDETSGILKSFITKIENLVDKKVKVIRCDNETEFKNKVMSEFDAGHSNKETGSSQDYIVMPLWKDDSLFDSSSKNASDAEPQPSSDIEKKDDEGVSKDSGLDDQERPANNTQDDNDVGPSINTASTNVNTGSSNINIVNPKVTTAPIEATYDDLSGYETEVDMSNITTTYPVSSTPNTRIHKDHSLAQVIGDIQSGVLTRGMTKTTNDQGFISVVYEGKTHEDLHTCLFACFLSQEEPKRIAKALSDSAWVEAMQEELLQNKKDERFISSGNKAMPWVDQDLLKHAFLYGKIEEEVYVCQPLWFEDPNNPDKVYKVVKALYGLHQAPRAWYETLAKYLLDNGFHKGKIDQTLLIKKQKGDILLVHVYVDDIIFGSTKKELCVEFEKLMHDEFQMSSMGELTFFLGLQVKQKEDGIFISQDKYVADILRKFGFTDVTDWIIDVSYIIQARYYVCSKVQVARLLSITLKIRKQQQEVSVFPRTQMISWQCKKQTGGSPKPRPSSTEGPLCGCLLVCCGQYLDSESNAGFWV